MNAQQAANLPPLPPPSFPDASDGGLGYDDLLNPPDRPILVELGPWAGFEPGDILQLVGPPVRELMAITSPLLAGSDGVVRIYLDGKTLAKLKDGDHQVGLQVVRASGEVIGPSMTTLRIRLTRPGVGDDGAVELTPPRVEPATITATTSKATVTVDAYLNMSVGDTVSVIWGVAGNEVSRVIGAGDVGKPLVFTIDRAVINAGGTGTGINVAYRITDVSGDTSMSPSTDVEVVDPSRLDAPVILESTLVDGGYVIDLDKLAGAAATAMITSLQAGDTFAIRVSGTTAAGLPVDYRGPERTATQVFHSEEIPNAFLASLLKGEAALWYVRTRGGAEASSHRFSFSVVGRSSLLMAPEIVEAEGDSLDAERVLVVGKATLRIPYNPAMKPGTRVRYDMRGTTTDGTTIRDEGYVDIDASTNFPLQFDIASNEINALDGSSVTFTYKVLVYGDGGPGKGKLLDSIQAPERTYRIHDPSLPLMPPALVPQADRDTINPEKIENNIGVKVTVAYPDMRDGDEVTLYWYGSIDKTRYTKTITYRGSPLTFLVPKSPYVIKNLSGTVTVMYTVKRDDVTFHAEEARFNVGAPVPNLMPPIVDRSADGKLDITAVGDRVIVRIPETVVFQAGDVVSVSVGEYKTATLPAVAGMVFEIPAAELGHYVGKVIPVSYTLTRNGQSYESERFPVEISEPQSLYVNFEDVPYQNLNPGVPVSSLGGAIVIRSLRGDTTIERQGAVFSPFASDRVLHLMMSQVQFDMRKPKNRIRFGVASSAPRPSTLTLYGDDGLAIATLQINIDQSRPSTSLGTIYGNWFDYTAPQPFKRFIITDAGWTRTYFDHFTLD